MQKYDSTKDTLEHIDAVRSVMRCVISDLITRADIHDRSKLASPEKEAFDELTPKLKGSTYGSDEYKGFLKQMAAPLAHHYAHNDHHPEYFGNCICSRCGSVWCKPLGRLPDICDVCHGTEFRHTHDIGAMSLIQLTEMLCDWIAAGRRHANSDIFKSIEVNQKRFGYGDDLKRILINTASHILKLEKANK